VNAALADVGKDMYSWMRYAVDAGFSLKVNTVRLHYGKEIEGKPPFAKPESQVIIYPKSLPCFHQLFWLL
jgi:hypothetical protein